jgi:hypothetical protein
MILDGMVVNYKVVQLIKIYNSHFGYFSIQVRLNNPKFWISKYEHRFRKKN